MTTSKERALQIQRAWHKIPENRKRQSILGKERKHRIKKEIITKLGGKCVCCGVSEWWNLTIDHIKPTRISKTGYNSDWWQKLYFMKDLSSYQCLCFGCNSSKGVREKCTLNHGDFNKP